MDDEKKIYIFIRSVREIAECMENRTESSCKVEFDSLVECNGGYDRVCKFFENQSNICHELKNIITSLKCVTSITTGK